MLIVLVGPERFLVAQALERYLQKYAPDGEDTSGFNLVRLDGARLTPDELLRVVQSAGFFSHERVVVVEGLLSRFGGVGGTKAADDDEAEPPTQRTEQTSRGRGKAEPGLSESFARVFESVPQPTVLILVERGSVNKNSSLFKAAARYGKVEEYIPPKGVALERWIADRCKQVGVQVTSGAITAMASALPDLQALANEIDKLALYVGTGGTIDEQALHELSFISTQDDIFEMTSAAARRDTKAALQQLHRLLNSGTSAEGILPVLAWQIRTLMQVRDMLDRKIPESRMASISGLGEFVVRKTLPQARRFSMSKLRKLHEQLLQLDHAVKTGRADAAMSMDALVVEMCQ
jgi:DNA polymerase-3 subunit delta